MAALGWGLEETRQDDEGQQDVHPVLPNETLLSFFLLRFLDRLFLLVALGVVIAARELGAGAVLRD